MKFIVSLLAFCCFVGFSGACQAEEVCAQWDGFESQSCPGEEPFGLCYDPVKDEYYLCGGVLPYYQQVNCPPEVEGPCWAEISDGTNRVVIDLAATDPCGREDVYRDSCWPESERYVHIIPASTEFPAVSGPEEFTVGAQYTVTDGHIVDPTLVNWSAPGDFSVSGDGRTITITSVPEGACELAPVVFVDDCKRQAILPVKPAISPLTLSGPDAPVVGSQYSAGGGVPPYTWTISCGAISGSGQVTNLSGCCGSGTVKATDACGEQKQVSARFPAGQWVQQGGQINNMTYMGDLSAWCWYGPCYSYCHEWMGVNKSYTETIGDARMVWYGGCYYPNSGTPSCASGSVGERCRAGAPPGATSETGCNLETSECGNLFFVWKYRIVYKWQCP